MGKKISAVVIALVATQLLSGCYFLRELNWSQDVVPKGKNSTATIGLQPSGADDDTYFFMGMVGKGSGFTPKAPTFDAENVAGLKEKLIADNSIGDLLDENCQTFAPAVRRGPPGLAVWRTEDVVPSDKETKLVVAKLKAKRDSPNQGGGFAGLILTGEWVDDGDGVPEDPGSTDDAITCTGESTTSLLLKGNDP
ncbi:MAG: hypothetical protein QOI31_235 [Solirubrobacterales bacterium]|jgi:hypothetical protein|nr:hypothetical protein [Solirubrobacterales bacterium]